MRIGRASVVLLLEQALPIELGRLAAAVEVGVRQASEVVVAPVVSLASVVSRLARAWLRTSVAPARGAAEAS